MKVLDMQWICLQADLKDRWTPIPNIVKKESLTVSGGRRFLLPFHPGIDFTFGTILGTIMQEYQMFSVHRAAQDKDGGMRCVYAEEKESGRTSNPNRI